MGDSWRKRPLFVGARWGRRRRWMWRRRAKRGPWHGRSGFKSISGCHCRSARFSVLWSETADAIHSTEGQVNEGESMGPIVILHLAAVPSMTDEISYITALEWEPVGVMEATGGLSASRFPNTTRIFCLSSTGMFRAAQAVRAECTEGLGKAGKAEWAEQAAHGIFKISRASTIPDVTLIFRCYVRQVHDGVGYACCGGGRVCTCKKVLSSCEESGGGG